MFTKGQPRKVSVWLRNTELEQVQEFCYLGSLLTEDARCDKEVTKRIVMAKAAFMRRGELLRGNISRDSKKRMVKTLVWSVALYGSETWTLRKEDIKRIQAFEMWIWRKMEKSSWTAHVSNEEVLSLVNEQRCLVHVIKQRQANWIGHGHDCLLKTVLEGKMEGKWTRGKPRRKMLDLLMEQEDKKISYKELKRRAEDRIQWHHHHLNLP